MGHQANIVGVLKCYEKEKFDLQTIKEHGQIEKMRIYRYK